MSKERAVLHWPEEEDRLHELLHELAAWQAEHTVCALGEHRMEGADPRGDDR